MSNQHICPECGTPLPADAPSGLCPKCLMQLGFESQFGSSSGPAGAPTVYQPRSLPPSVAQLAEKFPQLELFEQVGQGGMGVVYKARQKDLDRIVALKVLRPEIESDPTFAERFVREARALAKLSHPAIVTVYDFGRIDGLYYFIMEYVEGANLRELERSGRLSPEQALAIVPQICDALQYAHDQGVVHRDIKPENILLDTQGRVKIADFGLAKMAGNVPDATALTGAWQVMGTPQYMAPEQMQGAHQVDHRADIYSLGVVIYEMLTGELPIGRFPLPSQKVQVDVRLDEVVLRALEREPERRYQRASEVKTEFNTIVGQSGQATSQTGGREYRSKVTLFGLPLLHIASGLDPQTGKPRMARGVIAIGERALGVVAIGNLAMGGLACGGAAIGLVSLGGLAVGLLAAIGGMGIGGLAFAGVAAGFIAIGGAAAGYYAAGGQAWGQHIRSSTVREPAAMEFFGTWVDGWPQWLMWIGIGMPLAGGVLALLIWLVFSLQGRRTEGRPRFSRPLAKRQFAIPVETDVFSQAKFYFSGLGYEVAHQDRESCAFTRGDFWAGLWSWDVRALQTLLTVRLGPPSEGRRWVSCVWIVSTFGQWISQRQKNVLIEEGEQFEALFRGVEDRLGKQPSGGGGNSSLDIPPSSAVAGGEDNENQMFASQWCRLPVTLRRATKAVLVLLAVLLTIVFLSFQYRMESHISPEGEREIEVTEIGAGSPWYRSERGGEPGSPFISQKINLLSGSMFAGVLAVCLLILLMWIEKIEQKERDRQAASALGDNNADMAAHDASALRQEIKGPAAALLLSGLAALLSALFWMAWSGIQLNRIYSLPAEEQQRSLYDQQLNDNQAGDSSFQMNITLSPHSWWQYRGWMWVLLVSQVLACFAGIVMMFAGLHAAQRQSRGLVLRGCSLALLPLSMVWPVTLVVGLWLRNLINRPRVQAAFAQAALMPADSLDPADQILACLRTSTGWAVGLCLIGGSLTFLPWSMLSIFGYSVVFFGFEVWQGMVTAIVFPLTILLLVGLAWLSPHRLWRSLTMIFSGVTVAIVAGHFTWMIHQPMEVTRYSMQGDAVLADTAKEFTQNMLELAINGSWSPVSAMVCLLGLGLIVLGLVQLRNPPVRQPALVMEAADVSA